MFICSFNKWRYTLIGQKMSQVSKGYVCEVGREPQAGQGLAARAEGRVYSFPRSGQESLTEKAMFQQGLNEVSAFGDRPGRGTSEHI